MMVSGRWPGASGRTGRPRRSRSADLRQGACQMKVAVAASRMTRVPSITFRSDMTVELVKHAASDADVIWAARVSTKGEQ